MPTAPASACRRRTRRGSKYQISASAIRPSVAAIATLAPSCGKMFIRNAMVSASITIRSTKFTVISSTSCLNCDSRIRTARQASDSAAATAGRRSSSSKPALSRPQVSRNARARDERAFGREQDRERREMQRDQHAGAADASGAGGVEQTGRQGGNGGRHQPNAAAPGLC